MYMYVCIHTHIFCMHKCKKRLCEDNKISALLPHNALYNTEQKSHIYIYIYVCIYILEPYIRI